MSLLFRPAQPTAERLQSLPALLASFASAFEQSTRLLKVNFAAGSGIPANTLLPHRLTGSEAINVGFRYELKALSSDVHLELKSLLGIPVEVTLVTDAGTDRELCGLVTEAHQEGSDGGFAVYRLVIESGLSVLRKRINARVFVGIDVREVTRRILSEHLDRNAVLKAAFAFEDRCTGTYPTRPFWMQYNESDLDYLRRIWAREGISFVLQPSVESSPEHPQHTLALFDDVYRLEANASATARFHRADGTEQADAIQQWNGVRRLQCGSLARMGWDHGTASPVASQEANAVKQGDLAVSLASTLEDYRHHAPLEDEDADSVATLTRRHMQAREGLAKRFEGQGTVRTFAAGTWFTLAQHPIHDQDEAKDREFLITRLEVEAENNLPKDLQAGLSAFFAGEAAKPTPPYTNTFTCIRRGIPILTEEIDPTDPGMIPARVVGSEQSVVHTDDLGRIKVRFLLTRGCDHPEGGASETDADSAWIRQVETWGSQGFGGSFLPRVGDEVAVEFLGGDPDKPVITGSLHHRTRGTAAFSDASVLPTEKALSGVRSCMHKGAGGNELLFDDTTHQLRTRLASDHAASHLNLGYLVHPRSVGSGTPRGEGFELRTDAWGAVRAEKGLLLTTFRTTGPHLEADPLAGQMESSLELATALSETGEPLGAEKLEANDALKTLKECAQKKKAQGASGKEVPAFNAPVLGLASPDGILSATPASHVLSAGEHLHLTSGEDTNLGIGKRLAMAIKESWSIFVSKSGIKLFAAKEDFQVQAHEGSIQILADKDAKVTSSNGEIQVLAKKHIKLTAGQCQIEVTEKDVNLYMAGPITIKGNLSFGGVQTGPPELPFMPKGEVEELIQERHFRARIYLGADQASHQDDRFTLKSTDGAYVKTRTLKDDLIPGDEFVDLDYPGLMPDTTYALEVVYGEDGSTVSLFEDVPCSGLCTAVMR